MRKFALVVLAVCVLVVLVLAVLPHFLDVNHYRPQIQSELQNRLGRPVSLGNIRASFLPPSLIVKDVAIGEDARFGTGSFAKVQELDVRVALLPLLQKNLQVKSLQLTNPQIQLIKDQSGQWNYESLGKPQSTASQTPPSAPAKPVQPAQPTQPAPQSQPATSASSLTLDHLDIRNGSVSLIDRKENVQNTYDNIDVRLDNFAPGKRFDVDAALHIAGRRDEQIKVSGTAGPMQSGASLLPFDGSIDLKQVSIGDLQKVANIAALQGYTGIASGTVKAKTENGVIHADGSLKVEDPQIRATSLGYPITADFKLDNNLSTGVLNIVNGTLKLGPTPVSFSGTMNTTPTPAQLDMRVTTQGASLSELARLAAASGVAFNAGTNIKGTLNADITARGAATNPALNGNLKATGIEISGGQIKQPVTVPQIELALTPTSISSNPFVAKTGGTQLNTQFSLKDYTGNSPAVNASINTQNANVGELLAVASAYGVSAVDGMTGSGVISLNLTAAGPIKNASAMVFNGNGTLQNASLNTQALTKPLNVKNANIRFSQNSMALDNVQFSLGSSNAAGNIAVKNFAAPQVQFALNIDKLDMAEAQKIIATPGAPVKTAEFHLIPQAFAATTSQPAVITRVAGNGTISVGTLTYDQLVMTDVKSNVTLNHGIIQLSPLTGNIYGGQETGQIMLDTRTDPAVVTVTTKLQKVDANKLVSSVSSMKDTLYGLLAANTNASFRAASGTNLAQSLNGKLSLDLSNGRIAKVDMLNQLASIGKFLNASSTIPQQPFTTLTKLTGTFNVVNGVAQTNDLRAVIPGANLAGNGSVNLANNTLNMHVTAVMSKDFSQKVGGNGIGGFMQTALANNQGELVIPVLITGTFDHPVFAPDVQQVAQMKLQNLVPSFGNPGSMTSGLLGSVLGNKKGGQQGGLSGILGGLTGQQQQQQKKQQSEQNQQPTPNQTQQNQPNAVGDLLDQVLHGKKKKPQQ